MQADVHGDWREEAMTVTNGELRIFSTTIPAMDRRVCLMQDPNYRQTIAANAMGYIYDPALSYLPTDLAPRSALGRLAGLVGLGGAFGGIVMGQGAGWGARAPGGGSGQQFWWWLGPDCPHHCGGSGGGRGFPSPSGQPAERAGQADGRAADQDRGGKTAQRRAGSGARAHVQQGGQGAHPDHGPTGTDTRVDKSV